HATCWPGIPTCNGWRLRAGGSYPRSRGTISRFGWPKLIGSRRSEEDSQLLSRSFPPLDDKQKVHPSPGPHEGEEWQEETGNRVLEEQIAFVSRWIPVRRECQQLGSARRLSQLAPSCPSQTGLGLSAAPAPVALPSDCWREDEILLSFRRIHRSPPHRYRSAQQRGRRRS